jgi:hypothetical protein
MLKMKMLMSKRIFGFLLILFCGLNCLTLQGGDVPPGPEPEDNLNRTISLILPVVMDGTPLNTNFGSVVTQPPSSVRRGDTISVTFVSSSL